MRVSDFHFDLPLTSIATEPLYPRDRARLLVVSDHLSDKHIADLPELLNPGDLLVFNDTKVLPVRLNIFQDGRKIEVTLHKELKSGCWKAFAKPARKLRTGMPAQVAEDFTVMVLDKTEGEVTLEFNCQGDVFFQKLSAYGSMPLPPYIKRKEGLREKDLDDYQTIFARHDGAVAAPTAGLHFTPALFDALAAKAIAHTFVTLHVGAGTFLPVKVEEIKDHLMHREYGVVGKSACDMISATRARGGKVIAVGTTSLRILEAAAMHHGRLAPFEGETDIFITPGYQISTVDRLLTNFHLPESTLLMLVSALIGLKRVKEVYTYAIKKNYRFYSFGDACLLNVSPEAKGDIS